MHTDLITDTDLITMHTDLITDTDYGFTFSKGIIHSEMKIRSSFTHPHVIHSSLFLSAGLNEA